MRLLPLLLGPLLFGGCTRSAAPPVAPVEEVHVASRVRPTQGSPPAPTSSQPAVEGKPLPSAPIEAEDQLRAQLGVACDPNTRGCGSAGRIAVASATEMHPFEAWRPKFCTLERLTSAGAMQHVAACADHGFVAIASRCIVCRIDRREHLVGVVAEMTTEQLQLAQKMAGFPASPVLATERDWKDAIMQRRKLLPPDPLDP